MDTAAFVLHHMGCPRERTSLDKRKARFWKCDPPISTWTRYGKWPDQSFLFGDMTNGRAIRHKLPFRDYATIQWLLHAEKAEGCGIQQQHQLWRLVSPPGPVFQNGITLYNVLRTEDTKFSEPGSTILHIASASNLRSVFVTLKNVADTSIVNQPDNSGSTPLHYAARWGHEELAKMLLNAVSNLEAKDKKKNTPLVHAAATPIIGS